MEADDAPAPVPAPDGGEDGDFETDLGNMTLFDRVAAEPSSLTERGLRLMAERRCQHLVGLLFGLPTRKADDGGRLATLPAPSTAIPREKPPPKEKPATKWEEFRKEKGLRKRKREGKVFSEARQDWLPTHGAKRRRAEREEDWVREVPANYKPLEEGGDVFLDDRIRRRERVAKQRKQQEANVRRAAEQDRSSALGATMAKLNTASMGRFDAGGSKAPKGLGKGRSKSAPKNKKSMQRRRGGKR
eukprot:TRINITY_DN55238_c0_g1_i1.p2 TRINITY_DN55238_c0_g1~~TRINITY_DN55238_c0_g1_i1.p2  ORF type:complete len:270 (+),score=112.91 TRINITY_DN55238_c0_g1_i1:78-812(+)